MATRTFLFVDQVGSTEQLTQLGDQAAHDVRRALFDLLRQATEVAGGEEVDFTGDGLFCAFDGAAEAVDAAVAMQQLVWSFNERQAAERRLAVRVGLNTGEPLESEGGGYFGAAVVVAARLCAAAQEGQILVADLVRSLVEPRGAHGFTPMGPISLKGVPQPVRVFAVDWHPDQRHAQLPPPLAKARSGLAPFVGRRRESREVFAAWEAVRDGGRRLVLVSGDRGMGVSRFVAEMAHRLTEDGAALWYGEGSGATARLAPWAQALTTWAQSTSRAQLRLAMGGKAGDLVRLAPDLDRLVPRLPPPTPMAPASEVFLIAEALDELCARWSRHEPLVVVLDRLEDADADTFTVLRRLLESPREGRLLVVAAYEPSQVGTPRVLAAVGDLPNLVDLRLAGLGEDEVQELVEAVTLEPVAASSLRAVLNESEGSPYFVLQMALALREQGVTRHLHDAVGRAEELRTDLRLRREEITLGLRQLEQLRSEAGTVPAQPVEPDGTPPANVECPFKGLVAFQAADAEDFFGRELLTAELVARLVSSRFLAVVGPSGSGKSSAVRAGLLPALAGGAVPGSQTWVLVVCTPGADPIESIVARERDAASGRSLVLVVDQFEELWTSVEPQRRGRVLDTLVDAAADAEQNVVVVVVMRADYYGRTAEHAGLAALMAESQVLVGPMTPSEMRAAIETPARRTGLVVEQGLAQAVIDDIGHEPGGLPLLSTALLETWERRRGRSLTLAGYAETGGARRAIAHLADAAYDELSDAEQAAARRLLLRLAAPDGEGHDVARPAPLAELTSDEVSRRVLGRLADRRLVTLGRSTAQVAHEALLREWPRLRTWLAADREGRRLQHLISRAAADWDATGRDDEALLRGVRLAAAEEWHGAHSADLTAVERQFLAASLEARQGELRKARRTARRFQILAAGLVVLLLGALAAGGFALVQRRAAAQRAEQAAARGLAAQAIALSGNQADTAMLLAVEGYRRDASIDTEGGLLAALNAARYLTGFHRGLPGDAQDIATSPDRRTVFVLTTGGELRRYDTRDWRQVGGPVVKNIRNPYTVTVSRDGRLVAYAAAEGVHVVEVATGRRIGTPRGGTIANGGGFSRDGKVLVTSTEEVPGAKVFDLGSGRELGWVRHGPVGAAVDVHPTADELVVAPVDRPVLRRYRFDAAPLGPDVTVPGLSAIRGIKYSPDGRYLGVIGDEAIVQMVDAATLAPVGRPFTARGSRVGDLTFTPSGEIVAAGADDGSVRVAETETGTVVATVSGLSGPVGVEFLDADRLIATTADETAEFDLRRRTALGRIDTREQEVWEALATPGGSAAVLAVGDGIVQRPGTPDEHRTPIPGSGPPPDMIALSPDGRLAAVHRYPAQAGQPGAVTFLDLPAGTARRTVALPGDLGGLLYAGRLDFSPDGKRLAIGTFTGRLFVVDVESGRLIVPGVQIDFRVLRAVRWSRDGATLFVGGQEGVLKSVDPADGTVRAQLRLSPEVTLTDADPVPGTSLLAVSSEGGSVYLVDTAAYRVDGPPLSGAATGLQAVAVTPDGARVAALGGDGAVRLWDRASRRAIGPPLAAHEIAPLGLAVLSDGGLVTGGFERAAVSWDMDPTAWTARACTLAGRDLTRAEWRQYLPDWPYRRTCTELTRAGSS